jgi:NAD(P)-dependent dehydrogenase (short-subunit alcohol dehydrogenase family)
MTMQSSVFSLENKLALITGGGTGIGLGIATSFINAGAKVIITGRREDVLIKAVAELGKNANYLQNDISEHKKIPEMIRCLEKQYGPIDILVNNAGKHLKKLASDTTDEEFLDIINVNLLSVFSLTRCCAENMLKRKKGCILMISSMTALFGMDQVAAYGASKAGLTGLLNGLVTEYSKSNVRVNAIAPGWIESDIFFNAINGDSDRKQKIVNRIAMDQFGKPEDIGNAAVFLCSDAAKYVTGVILPVDGGAAINM